MKYNNLVLACTNAQPDMSESLTHKHTHTHTLTSFTHDINGISARASVRVGNGHHVGSNGRHVCYVPVVGAGASEVPVQ